MPVVHSNYRYVAAAAARFTVAPSPFPPHTSACSRRTPRVANIGSRTGSWSDGN